MILAIDPATTTGFVIFDEKETSGGKQFILYSHGYWTLTHLDNHGKLCNEAYAKLTDILVSCDIQHAFIENYFFARRAPNGADVNYKIRAAYEMALSSKNIEYTFVAPSSWYSFVVGPSGRALKGAARKQRVRLVVRERYGLDAIPEREGRRLTPYDVFDAAGIGIYGMLQRWPGSRISPRAELESAPAAS